MGDRTSVSLRIGGVIKDRDQLRKISELIEPDGPEFMGNADDAVEEIMDLLIDVMARGWENQWIEFYEINYGNLDCLNKLHKLGIETYHTHGSGAEYAAGGEVTWFENGKPRSFEWYDGDKDHIKVKDIETLLRNPDTLATELRKLLDEHKADHARTVAPLIPGSKDLQEEVAVRAAKARIGVA
jgi:hypothetical protein